MPKVKWARAVCPYCGETYEYIEGGYKPPTCCKFECLHKHLHPEIHRGKN